MMNTCKIFIMMLLVNGLLTPIRSQTDQEPGYAEESDLFVFYHPYWLNLHHFLKHHSLPADGLKNPLFSRADWPKLSATEQATLDRALHYYRTELIDEDLRTSDLLYEFKGWIGRQADDSLSDEVPEAFRNLVATLQAADPVYRDKFWPEHRETIRGILQRNRRLVAATEQKSQTRTGAAHPLVLAGRENPGRHLHFRQILC